MNADTIRRLENIVRFGQIDSVTPSSPFHTVTVSLNGIVTGQLRLLNARAGKDQTHDLPSKGEECLVLSPSGELAQGVVIVGLNNDEFPTISQNPNVVIRMFEDGAVISYDKKAHHLGAILPNGATATIKADLLVDGKLHCTKDITTDADVKAGDISLKKHKTSGVQSGSNTSGVPSP
ncbi:phage baseplate assembly protein V [Acinetobacter sp. HY1485]|uniref:phage baseplate assembly protein V n=1 Tax=Acinetobacter sp. HY1485 TaxID=2970918 RepID=UPI0022B96F02|nr:phage baseplate assembly protein V [Acinetobacter sp. HY1485]